MRLLRQWFTDPRVASLDPDSAGFSLAHREVLLGKPLVQALFRDFYRRCRVMDQRHFSGTGTRLELGSGAGFLREHYPDVVTSDVKPLPFVQLVCRGETLPLRNASVRALYAINTFHHIPDPRAFFAELRRVLVRGGGLVMIEPYHGPVAARLFRGLHASEGFDPHSSRWESDDGAGSFTGANQALSYVVFRRDRAIFEREFPELEIVEEEPHTHLRYVVSGGVNFRQLIPTAAGPLAVFAERLLSPFDRWLALQHTIVLRRR